MPPTPSLSALARLVLPVSCAGCGRWETALCPECASLLAGPLQPVDHLRAVEDLEVMTLARYTGPMRSIVLGWKNGAREDLDVVVARAGRRAGAAWAGTLPGPAGPAAPRRSEDAAVSEAAPSEPAVAHEAAPPPTAPCGAPLLVVPAPSGLGRRLRGRLVVARLADDVARGVADGLRPASPDRPGAGPAAGSAGVTSRPAPSTPVLSADVLRRDRHPSGAHQAGRSARGRRSNRAREPRVLAEVTGARVLLVDDVVTTGATLGGCARAMRDAGADVLGALVLAAAPAPSRSVTRVPGGVVAAVGRSGGAHAAPPDHADSAPGEPSPGGARSRAPGGARVV